MLTDWSSIFDMHGAKRVSLTDKRKGAYLPDTQQRAAMAAAGIFPSSGSIKATHRLATLGDPTTPSLVASYYNAERAGADRQPEARMGQELISWVDAGDILIIGLVGQKLLIAREGYVAPPAQEVGRQLAEKLDSATVFARARRARGRPVARQRHTTDFKRNPYVVAGAILRANGACEMPGCSRQLFRRADGSAYLEVHHIVPLAGGVDDTLVNVAAICPSCHREAHHGELRHGMQAALAAYIVSLMTS